MTTVCTVSGILKNLQGEILVNTAVGFSRAGVVSQYGDAIIPFDVQVLSDLSGAVSFDIYPGNYVGTASPVSGRVEKFTMAVPEAATADLADLIGGSGEDITTGLTQIADALSAETSARIAGDDANTEGTYYAGTWDASAGAFPQVRGEGGAVQAGDYFDVSISGTIDGQAFEVGERIKALVDAPSSSTISGNWYYASTIAILEPLNARIDEFSIPFDTVPDLTADTTTILQYQARFGATAGTVYAQAKSETYTYALDLEQGGSGVGYVQNSAIPPVNFLVLGLDGGAVFAPEQFGDVDGVADEVQINAALDYLDSLGGGRLVLKNPNGYETEDCIYWPSNVYWDQDAASIITRSATFATSDPFDYVVKSQGFDDNFMGMISGTDSPPKGQADDVHTNFGGNIYIDGNRFQGSNDVTTKHNLGIYGKSTGNVHVLSVRAGGDGVFLTNGTPFTNQNYREEPVQSGIKAQVHQNGRDGFVYTGPNDGEIDKINSTRSGRHGVLVYNVTRNRWLNVNDASGFIQGETITQSATGAKGILIFADTVNDRLYFESTPKWDFFEAGAVVGVSSAASKTVSSTGSDSSGNRSNSKVGIGFIHSVGGGNADPNGCSICNIGLFLYGGKIQAETGRGAEVWFNAPQNDSHYENCKVWKSSSPTHFGAIMDIASPQQTFGKLFIENDGSGAPTQGVAVTEQNTVIGMLRVDGNNKDGFKGADIDAADCAITSGRIQECKGVDGAGMSISTTGGSGGHSINCEIVSSTKGLDVPNNLTRSDLTLKFSSNGEDISGFENISNNVSMNVDGIQKDKHISYKFANGSTTEMVLTTSSEKFIKIGTATEGQIIRLPDVSESAGLVWHIENPTVGGNQIEVRHSTGDANVTGLNGKQASTFVVDIANGVWRSIGKVAVL